MIKQSLQQLNTKLSDLLPQVEGSLTPIIDASYYTLLSKGKRLRPMIPILIAKENGLFSDELLGPVLSLELIHTYSLIHDDLPCMDDDDFRRGKPSLHKAYSEEIAVLTGDFLLTYAFENIAKRQSLSPEARVALLSSLAHCSGIEGLIGGQMMDLKKNKEDLSFDELEEIYKRKTANLFICSFAFGSIFLEGNEEEKQLFQSLGLHFGIIFQYLDDLEDYDHDLKKEALSATRYFSLEAIHERIALHLNHFQKILSALPFSLSFIAYLLEHLLEKKEALHAKKNV